VNKSTIQLYDDEVAVFGYGSLLAVTSLEQTLQRPYDGPFVACSVEGWRRSWEVTMPNQTFYTETKFGRFYPQSILYLNVQAQAGILLNGVLFVISVEELKAMDQREWIYNREVITDQLCGISVAGGDAYMYVAKPEYIMTNVKSPAIAAIRATYLQILETGLSQLGQSFRKAYNRSSDPVPQHLVITDIRDERAPNPFGKKQLERA
jgi:cation transport regulator ChaC